VSESADLVTAVIAGRRVPGLRVFAPIGPGPVQERPITVDQTNRSVVVGERVVVKWMRSPGADRSPRLLAHLAEAGFTRMPTPHAALFRGGDLVALITQFLPGALDGWDWGVDALLDGWNWRVDPLDGRPAAGFGADLGTLAAELHAALATPTSVIPEPVKIMAGAGDWRTAADEAVTAADDEWVRSIAPRLAADLASDARERSGPALVLHGDLHIGQILKWHDRSAGAEDAKRARKRDTKGAEGARGHDAGGQNAQGQGARRQNGGEQSAGGTYAVTDFDGHPTAADRPEPLARDVAQLRTSVLHVAEIANKRTEGRRTDELRQWGRDTADELLTAYRKELGKRSLSHLFDPDLLRVFEVEQECRELVYAARFLPRWQYAPTGVLKSWYAR
jgi:maltokinase